MGFSRQEYWSGLSCPSPGDLPDPGIETASLVSPALAGDFFTTSATWEALKIVLLERKERKKVKSLSRVQLFVIACEAPPSMEFSRQEYWSGLPFPVGFKPMPPGETATLHINWLVLCFSSICSDCNVSTEFWLLYTAGMGDYLLFTNKL